MRPMLGTLGAGRRLGRPYVRSDLWHDILGGLVLASLVVPAGMAYATVAGLPPVQGLYASLAATLAYALVGPSRLLVVGPDSSIAPLIAAAVIPLAGGDPGQAVALAGLLAVLVGVLLIAAGAIRLGAVADLVSRPIRVGFLNGVAIVILAGQLPRLVGFDIDPGRVVDEVGDLIAGVRAGDADGLATLIGFGVIALLLAGRAWWPRVPAMLFVVLGAAGASALWHPDVALVGVVPRGMPHPRLGGLTLSDLRSLLLPGIAIAIVVVTDTAALTRSLAGAASHDVDDSGELVGLGAANLASGLLGGFPVSSSASRTPPLVEAGAVTQHAAVTAAAVIALILTVAPAAIEHLPLTVLAAVVVVALVRVVDVHGLRELWRMDRREFSFSLVTTAGVVFVGVLEGIAVALALAFASFLAHAWRPHTAELGRVDGRKGYHDIARHPDARRIPGLVILRFDAPLFFANAGAFVRFLRSHTRYGDVGWVLLSAEPITDIDTSSAEALARIDAEFEARGIRLCFAELKGPVKDRLERYGLGERFAARTYATVGSAVAAYLDETGTEYTDWTDR